MASRTAVAVVVLGTIGCSRVRDIPLSELPKLSPEHRQSDQPVVVTSRKGKRVLIDSFSRVEVMRQQCPREDYCYDVSEGRIERLQSIRLLSGQVELVGLEGRRRPQRVTRVVAVDDPERWARISERSWSRGMIVGGVAVGVGLAVFVTVSRVASAKDSDPHGLRAIFVGQMSGAAAGGTTLIFTLPATRHLGSEVE